MAPTGSTTFGALLKQLRKRAGMTQADLAAAVGYSVSFVSDLEQNRRLPAVAVVLQQFIPALGLQEEAGFATHLVELAALARGEQPPPTLTVQRKTQLTITETFTFPTSHLPAPPTELIGREHAIKTLCNRLQGHSGRLLTLVGPPGVGKTRLALAVAHRLAPMFKGGARFVALAAVSDPELVATTIANELGLADTGKQAPQARLIQGLRQQELLLLLDNFEQIMGAAPLLATLLAQCPGVSLLVTSRERLHLRAEQRFAVAPLEVSAAVALFVQRAQAVDPNFGLNAANAPVIHQLCQRLDYLPLAIELLAARIDLCTPQVLLTRLQDHSLDLLVDGPRDLPMSQRTLRRAIQHSYSLLDEQEQALFRTLGVFVGDFDWAAVAHFGFAEGVLQALIHKSLVQMARQNAEPRRFLLLETLRDYAFEQLNQQGEAEARGRAHATYFLRLAESIIRDADDGVETSTIGDLELELNNLWAALRWAAQHDATLEMQLLTNLLPFWNTGRSIREGWRWVEAAMPRIKPEQTLYYADFLRGLAVLNWKQGTARKVQTYVEESIVLYRQFDHPAGLARSLILLAANLQQAGNPHAALPFAEEAVRLSRALGDPYLLADALNRLRWEMLALGDLSRARSLLDEAVMLWRKRENPLEIAKALKALAHVAFLAGDFTTARAQAEEALQRLRDLGEAWAIAQSLAWLARIAWRQGDQARAITVLEENLILTRALQADELLSLVLLLLGLARQAQGDRPRAQALFGECLAICQKHHVFQASTGYACAAYLFSGLAGLAEPLCAAQIMGIATKLLTIAAADLQDFAAEHVHYERILTVVRAQLDETTFTIAYDTGYAMTPKQAVAFVLTQVEGLEEFMATGQAIP